MKEKIRHPSGDRCSHQPRLTVLLLLWRLFLLGYILWLYSPQKVETETEVWYNFETGKNVERGHDTMRHTATRHRGKSLMVVTETEKHTILGNPSLGEKREKEEWNQLRLENPKILGNAYTSHKGERR